MRTICILVLIILLGLLFLFIQPRLQIDRFSNSDASSGMHYKVCDSPVPTDLCKNVNCGDHGTCQNGNCVCSNGWSGKNCETTITKDPCVGIDCGKNGTCQNGNCVCSNGWSGKNCEVAPYDPCENVNCGAHGTCNKGKCVCESGWSGSQCDKPSSLKSKAIFVIRHGQKGKVGSDKIQDPNPKLPYHISDGIHGALKDTYLSQALTNPLTGQPVKIYYADISKTGYEEGTSFATTVPHIMKDYQPITSAAILNPSNPNNNGNTYLTTYPLLKQLVQDGTLKKLNFYDKPENIDMSLSDKDGSLLIAGDATTLTRDNSSILSLLNSKYGQSAGELQRGRDIYVYYNSSKFKKFTQNPGSKTYS